MWSNLDTLLSAICLISASNKSLTRKPASLSTDLGSDFLSSENNHENTNHEMLMIGIFNGHYYRGI